MKLSLQSPRDGKWFIAYCPEIPGANGQGRTKAEARRPWPRQSRPSSMIGVGTACGLYPEMLSVRRSWSVEERWVTCYVTFAAMDAT